MNEQTIVKDAIFCKILEKLKYGIIFDERIVSFLDFWNELAKKNNNVDYINYTEDTQIEGQEEKYSLHFVYRNKEYYGSECFDEIEDFIFDNFYFFIDELEKTKDIEFIEKTIDEMIEVFI